MQGAMKKSMHKFAFIGGGNMAEALIKGMKSSGWEGMAVSEPRAERRQYLHDAYGVLTTDNNSDAAAAADIVVLCVKPQDMEQVLSELPGVLSNDKTVVSIAAGITISFIKKFIKSDRIIRVMPNVGALVQEGMHVMSLCECFNDSTLASVKDMFMSSGRVIVMPEKHINAVTALSGSGPAFIALFLSHMIEAGVSLGLREDDAQALAVQTLSGTSKLLNEGGIPPANLIKIVRSPGGTTAEGLQVFEQLGLKDTVSKAIEAACRRAQELSKG